LDKEKIPGEFEKRVRLDPFAQLMGIEIDQVRKGYARASLRIKDKFQNFSGYVHGGVIFSLADQAFAAASNSMEVLALGLQMNINYVSPARVGDKLTAEANQVNFGRRISIYGIQVRDTSGKLVADCQGTVYQKARKQSSLR
jgi:acyl-CoA thioesterase